MASEVKNSSQIQMGAADLLAGPTSSDGIAADHQLRNLIQAVSGYLELLATRTDDKSSLRYIGNAQTAAIEIANFMERIFENPQKEVDLLRQSNCTDR